MTVVEKGKLPVNWSAECWEIYALLKGLKWLDKKNGTIFTDSKYAYGVVHTFGKIWAERGFVNSKGKTLIHEGLIRAVLEALKRPKEIAVVHTKGHQKDDTREIKGNLADITAKRAKVENSEKILKLNEIGDENDDDDRGKEEIPIFNEKEQEELLKHGADQNEKGEWRMPEGRQVLNKALTRKILEDLHKTYYNNPQFFNQLFSGLDHHILAGRFRTETLNTSPYTYEVAPVLVLMEEQVLAKLRELVGWSSGDGIFAPGGSMSNMLAMNVARFRRFPESRSRGNWDLPRLGLFASQESHYSILKGAALLGIGTDNVHLVRTDERGKMIPEELEKEIQRVKAEGSEPLFVCATSGTTVLGAFDPLDAIADVCARHGLWLHVDAAWGGSALLSPRLRHLLAGIHRSDSVTWNPHKLLMVGLQCSAFLLRDSSGLLQRCHGVGASYLFQRDKFYDVSLDTGDKSPQCGRRADGLKLWILWKAVGTRGLAQRVERAFAASRYLLEQVKRREGFQLVMEVRVMVEWRMGDMDT
uniref:RNase H type-1 domain-containing protein n=1 Tax=Zonotrichia albicollis TaxID=44394 RepID=A0A8D2M4L7_ZONAL